MACVSDYIFWKMQEKAKSINVISFARTVKLYSYLLGSGWTSKRLGNWSIGICGSRAQRYDLHIGWGAMCILSEGLGIVIRQG
jgi:hypothetical protein